MTITLQKPYINVLGDKVRICAKILLPEGDRTLWYECDSSYKDILLTEVADSFLLAILPAAMKSGQDIEVQCAISEKLFYNITNYYIEFLRNILRGAHKIEVTATSLNSQNWEGKGVMTGFSAGIDSFCTFFDHYKNEDLRAYNITHLILNDVGAHEEETGSRDAVVSDHMKRMKKFSSEVDLPLIFVKSNIGDIIGADFLQTHTIRNTSVALLFQKICRVFLYSSGLHYKDTNLKTAYDIAYTDAVGVSLLSTDTISSISSGGQYTRFEKTEKISREPLSYNYLDVCITHDAGRSLNCTKCMKCLRTALTLDVLHRLEKYSNVFDMSVYQKFKILYLAHVLKNTDPFQKEITAQIKASGYHVPMMSKILSLLPARIILISMFRAQEIDDTRFFPVIHHAMRVFFKKRIKAA